MTPLTTHSQTRNFRDNGYLVLKNFLGQAKTREIHDFLDNFLTKTVPTLPREIVFYDEVGNSKSLKQIQKLHELDPFFEQLMFSSPFEMLAKELLQSEVRGVNMQYFDKPPRTSQPTPPHQDGYYFMLEPNEAVTMWYGLDAADEHNGGVRYIPGSHKTGMRSHRPTQTIGFSQGITDYDHSDRQQEVAVHSDPGDLLVHHALTIHRAEKNHCENRHRRALGFIYYSVHAKESPEKRERERALFEQWKNAGKI